MPAVVVVTEVFVNLAQTAARARGFDRLATLVLPHPMESRPAAEIRALAHARAAELLGLLVMAE